MAIIENQPGRWIGDAWELATLPPVGDVVQRLNQVGVPILEFGITVKAVYMNQGWGSRPFGFDFLCTRPGDLLALLASLSANSRRPASALDMAIDKATAVFNEDLKTTREGRFSSYFTEGRGFRQIGTGERLHIAVSHQGGKGNVHIDSHGYVVGPDDYDWGVNALRHGYWDLLSDKTPWLFRSVGDRGRLGPMAFRPILGLDGNMTWNFGITGYW